MTNQTHTEGPESPADEIDSPTWSDYCTLVCVECGAEVFEWSTPDLDRCWRCAEKWDFDQPIPRGES